MHQTELIAIDFTIRLKLETAHFEFGLEGNKYNNKSLNHASLNHTVHYATLQNTEPTIYQETIQLALRSRSNSFNNVLILLTSTGLI